VSAAYRSSFLPALDRAVSIDGGDLGFDRESGTVVAASRRPDGRHYGVVSEVPRYDDTRLRAARPGQDPAFADLALLPAGTGPPPAEIQRYAADAHFTRATPYDMFKAIEKDLQGNAFGYSPRATAGHSYAVLRGFLGGDPGQGGQATSRVGYSEQFAAAFALIARLRGFPSRVAVGYRLRDPRAAVGAEVPVQARDIHAWTEIHLNGVGWVPFDGTNPTERDPADPPPPAPDPRAPQPPPTVLPATPPTTMGDSSENRGCGGTASGPGSGPAGCPATGGVPAGRAGPGAGGGGPQAPPAAPAPPGPARAADRGRLARGARPLPGAGHPDVTGDDRPRGGRRLRVRRRPGRRRPGGQPGPGARRRAVRPGRAAREPGGRGLGRRGRRRRRPARAHRPADPRPRCPGPAPPREREPVTAPTPDGPSMNPEERRPCDAPARR
jgi:hypothetical protein